MKPYAVHLILSVSLLHISTINAQACWFAGPRVDCGWVGMDPSECTARGCCWISAEFRGAPYIDLPWCFRPNDNPSTYAAESQIFPTSPCMAATLSSSHSTLPELGRDLQQLKATAEEVAPGIIRFRLKDANKERWEVPASLFSVDSIAGSGNRWLCDEMNTKTKTDKKEGSFPGSSGLQVDWVGDPFSFRVLRHAEESSTGSGTAFDTKQNDPEAIWDSTGLRLVFKEQYIEFSTWIDSDVTLYGAGERASHTLHLERNGLPRTLWNHDLGPTFLEQNSYGSHPFVLALRPSGTAFGFFLLSSNGMDIIPAPDRLSWRVIGGIVDLFILAGPTPTDVLDQLTQVVGRPAMMPYWSLGWQQSKYGYKSIWEVEEVLTNYSRAGIPLEAIYTDIDHMDRWKDFTFDPVNYPLDEMQRFSADLIRRGQKWVPIVDPGIKIEHGYEPYEIGLKEGIFLRDYKGHEPYLGWVWPGATHFPDFLAAQGQEFLVKFLEKHHAMVPWDGIWIDMNEASNFCTGEACKFKSSSHSAASAEEELPVGDKKSSQKGPGDAVFLSTHQRQQKIKLNKAQDDPPPWVCNLDCSQDVHGELNATQRLFLDPPYAISNSLQRLPLGTKSLSVLATHLDGNVQYNTHNVYGLAECMVTSQAVANLTGKRPFVLSRSSYTGVGAYAAHWTGDNAATWDDMAMSLPGILSYGLFGMPMGGADVCGFQQNTTPELCARWVALAAVAYPFARSHSDLHSSPQEPYLWDSVAEAARNTLGMRYQLLSHLYTLHRIAHEKGTPVMRPLWLNYPKDASTHQMDWQVMVGDALLVSPVLEQGLKSVKAYFPGGTTWYDVFDEGECIDAR